LEVIVPPWLYDPFPAIGMATPGNDWIVKLPGGWSVS
jgi:hypothetical protein